MLKLASSLMVVGLTSLGLSAGTLTYGDEDLFGFGYSSDPTAGATVQGLAPNSITLATNSFGHSFPFTPDPGDFPGTDQIYVGSTQTGAHDGYSGASQRINGPQVLNLDYSSLIPAGSTLLTLTLGIAGDDFQFPDFGQPFTATVNGVVNSALSAQLNAFNETGPVTQFFTIGLDPGVDLASHILTLSIDEGGDGGDGWAVDFLTIGVTTAASSVAEPSTVLLLAGGLTLIGFAKFLRKPSTANR
jgi:hypothetical protein